MCRNKELQRWGLRSNRDGVRFNSTNSVPADAKICQPYSVPEFNGRENTSPCRVVFMFQKNDLTYTECPLIQALLADLQNLIEDQICSFRGPSLNSNFWHGCDRFDKGDFFIHALWNLYSFDWPSC